MDRSLSEVETYLYPFAKIKLGRYCIQEKLDLSRGLADSIRHVSHRFLQLVLVRRLKRNLDSVALNQALFCSVRMLVLSI
jgi:hypothetical protein